MKEILLINPGKGPGRKPAKKKPGTTQEKKNMSQQKKKKTTKRRATKSASTGKRSYSKKRSTGKRRKSRRRNPSGIAGRAASLFSFSNLLSAGKMGGGMLAAQFFAKKFAEGGGANDVNWTWKNYAFGVLGTFVAGLGADMVKRGSGQKFVQGGLAYLLVRAFVNELGPRSNFVETYFGQDGIENQGGMILGTDGNAYSPGDTYLGADGEVYLLGANGVWHPTSENYRDPALLGYGDDLAPVGPLGFGQDLEPVGPLGASLAPVGPLGTDPWMQTFTGQKGSGDPYADVFLN
jgi:hypothetical protein